MKKFKFKLSPLLKIKELAKFQLEQKLGKLNEEIRLREEEIKNNFDDIKNLLNSASPEGGTNLLIGFDYLGHRKKNIQLLKIDLNQWLDSRVKLMQQITQVTREIEKVEEIKNEKLKAWKKELTKKEEMVIEENYLIKNHYSVD
ncbi:MAG: hypothetical protein QE271_06100 [Bacteriovoracaceae bacterium]|nr:hypothetical protein [Bacteriovoracaceae bacterium]